MNPKISIIIPALNEENYLPKLLSDIKAQRNPPSFEVIVADGGSKDSTREIARAFGAKIVEGGDSPAIARNNGAKEASGDFLLFLDSDVRIGENFLSKAYREMQINYYEIATCKFHPLSSLKIDRIIHEFGYSYMWINRKIDPHLPGFCILTTRRLFERVDGFNERLKLSEDHDFARRASKFRPIEFLSSATCRVSVRRLEKEGRAALGVKYFQAEVYRLLNIKGRTIEYAFGEFEKKNRTGFLYDVDRGLLKIEEYYRKIASNGKRKKRKQKKRKGKGRIRSLVSKIKNKFSRKAGAHN